MAWTENKDVFRRFYEVTWNDGNLGVVGELLDEGFVNRELAGFARFPIGRPESVV